MSRAAYKGMRIEWFPDECAQPLPELKHASTKENVAPPSGSKAKTMVNRFQMLDMDGDETEDSSEDGLEPAVLSDMSSPQVSDRNPWSLRTAAA